MAGLRVFPGGGLARTRPLARSAQPTGAWASIAQRLFVQGRAPRTSFTPSEVEVSGQPFRLLTSTILRFGSADIEVPGYDIGYYATYTSFTPAQVEVAGSNFRLIQSRPPIQFIPTNVLVQSFGVQFGFIEQPGKGGNINVTSPGFRISRFRTLSFTPGNIEVWMAEIENRQVFRTRFTPASVEVTAPGFVVREALPKLRFTPGDVVVEGASIRLVPLVPQLLPELRPTGREFEPPLYPVKTGFTESKVLYQRVLADKAGGARLKLVYENIDDAQAEALLALYDQTKLGALPVKLSAATLDSVGSSLRAYLALPSTLNEWVMETPPSLTSEQIGVSTVVLQLRSRVLITGNQLSSILLGPCPEDDASDNANVVCDAIVPPNCALANYTGCA